jgi:hypothetical protein
MYHDFYRMAYIYICIYMCSYMSRYIYIYIYICLGGSILLSLIYLLRLDYNEKIKKAYLRREQQTATRELLEEDLKNGGKGDLGSIYYRHFKRIRDSPKKNKKVDLTMRRDVMEIKAGGPRNRINENVMKNDDEDNMKNDDEDDMKNDDDKKTHGISNQLQLHTEMTAVTEFLYHMFPGNSIFAKNGQRNVWHLFFSNHEYTRVFSGSSVGLTRTVRFLQVVIIILTALFTDTLFFGIFYPSDETCPVNLRKVTCLAAPSKVTLTLTLTLSNAYSTYM